MQGRIITEKEILSVDDDSFFYVSAGLHFMKERKLDKANHRLLRDSGFKKTTT